MQVVATGCLAHQTHLRQHGAAAAVGAACDPEDDGVIGEIVFGQQSLDVGDKRRQHTLGLGHRQRAGGQGHAGHGLLALLAHAVIEQAVLARQRLDAGLLAGRDARDDEVLVGGQAEVPLMHLGDLQHTGLEGLAREVQQAAVLDEQGQVVLAVDPLDPAEAIAAAGKFVGANFAKLDTGTTLYLGLEGLDPHPFKRVLGLGVLAVDPVAPVALGADHGGRHLQHVGERHEAEVARLARISGGVTVGHGQTPAHQHVEAHELSVFGNGHEVEIVGVDVHVVVGRDHHGRLEFARQVVGAQDRLLVTPQFLAVQPDLHVGAGLGQQVLGDFLGPLVGLLMQLGLHRVAGAQHVAVHVAGGGDGIDAGAVEGLVHQLDVALQYPVELEGLAGSQADAAVQAVFLGELVDHQPLGRGDDAAGQAGTQHDVVQGLQLLGGALGANVAVILLIHAVKADQLEVVAVEAASERVLEILLYGAAQKVALAFQTFVVGQRSFHRSRFWVRKRLFAHQ